MQDIINDGLVIIVTSLVIALFAIALIAFRPWKRRHRHRRHHSPRKRIDLFAGKPAEPASKPDA